MSRRPSDKEVRQASYRMKQLTMIREFGWMVQGVFPTEQDQGVCFGYTIGLTEAGLPELLISGNLSPEALKSILNLAAQRHIRDEIQPGEELTGLANTSLRVLTCRPDAPVQQARNLYGKRVRVLQLIWPDKQGRFPDEEGFGGGLNIDLDPQPLY